MRYYAPNNGEEAVKALQQVVLTMFEMEAEIVHQCKENNQLREALDEALLERDTARREICEYQPRYYGTGSVTDEAHNAAERRGWDCYKEETQ